MTRKLIVLSIAMLSLPAVQAAAQPRWGRERVPQAGACFYEDRNFGGRYFCVQPGEDLRTLPNGMGDKISSVRLLGASEVTVFRDSDLRGSSARFINDEQDLRRNGWNDKISSIAIAPRGDYSAYNGYGGYNGARTNQARNRSRYETRNGGTYGGGWQANGAPVWGRQAVPTEGACFYQDADFRGQYFCVPRGGTYTSLPRGFNDRISSVRVFGSGVRIYRDSDFRGRSMELRGDVNNLRGNWRDQVSSIRVF
jgi:hypothetical protein